MTTDSTFAQSSGQPFYRQAGLTIILAALFGGLLAGAQIILAPMVEANKLNEIRAHVPSLLQLKQKSGLPGQVKIERQLITGKQKNWVVFRAINKGEPSGWAILASGQGYAGNIELLLGLSEKTDTITGIYVLNQMETPGLGNKIGDPSWRQQFIGRATKSKLLVTAKNKGGQKSGKNGQLNTIDAITGATISSNAVCAITNHAISDLSAALNQKRLFQESSQRINGDGK